MELQAADGSLRERSSFSSSGLDEGFCGFCYNGPVYVGVPSMAALCEHLGRTPGLSISWGARVHPTPQVPTTALHNRRCLTELLICSAHACLLYGAAIVYRALQP